MDARILAALTAGLTVAAVALAPPAAAEPDLWACTPDEHVELGIPADEPCYLTGAELDARGWVPLDDAGDFWCAIDPDAPAWVQDTRKGPC